VIQKDSTPPSLTDRDLLAVLLNLMGELAVKLTGETPYLCVHDAAGEAHHLVPSPHAVTWLMPGDPPRCSNCRAGRALTTPP
jgi:hypothetical protein